MAVSSIGAQPSLVLVIDPEPAHQRSLRNSLLRLGYSARSADDHKSALAIVAATPPDIVLLTEQADVIEGWTELQTQLDNWGIPVLKLDAGKVGATNGAAAPNDAELRLRVEAALQSRNLYKALVVENARLVAERLQDPLTGLFNRRYAMIRTEEEVRRSSRHGYPLSCLLADIDAFDSINETWGHATGDGVLRDTAHVITRTLRSTDIVARYRDDEFFSLLTDTSASGAQIAANRVRDAVAEYAFFNKGSNEPVRVTISIGVSYWEPASKPGEGTWEPQMLALAERALKAAKLSGSNRLVMLQAA